MEKNFYLIYQNILEKDREINNAFEILAEPYIGPLLRAEIITNTEAELVKAEMTNEAKNDKLFLEIMPAKGQNGLNKLMELLVENHVGEELICYLNEVQEEDVHGKMFGNIPTPNLSFVGRKSVFDNIHKQFGIAGGKDESCNIVVLHGMGGVGKTDMAAEFIHKNKNNYNRVVWIPVSNRDACFVELAKELDLRGQTTEQTIGNVKNWFEKSSPCLIVFDDADNFKQIEDYLPRFGCNILVTSRYTNWPPTVAASIRVQVFSVEESESFVKNLLTGKVQLYAHDVYELGEILGRLPLAIAQACCYIRESMCNIADYVKMFHDRKHETELLSAQNLPIDMRNEENENTIMITWKITKEAIRKRSPIARKLLSLCAYFQCDSFPKFLTRIGFFRLNVLNDEQQLQLMGRSVCPVEVLAAMMYSLECDNDHFIEFSKAMTILTNFSMLTTNMKRDQFTMHCLLQKVIKIEENDERYKYITKLTVVLLIAFKYPKTAEYKKFRTSLFLPHVLEHLSTLERWNSKNVVQIKDMAAEISLEMKLYADARRLFEDLLKYREQSTEHNFSVIAYTLISLGLTCCNLNDVKMAEKYFQDTLNLCEEMNTSDQLKFEIDHWKIEALSCLLMMSSFEKKEYLTESESTKMLEKAISIRSDHLETEDRYELAGKMCNLGWLYSKNGEQIKAKNLFENALKTFDEALTSKKHISSDTSFYFGDCFFGLNDLNVRKDLFEKYLAILQIAFGQDDPEVIATLYQLAVVYFRLNDFGKAKELLEKVLHAQENYYGQDHPIIVETLMTLGCVLVILEEAAKSIVVLQKAFTLAEKSGGYKQYFTTIFKCMSVAYGLLGDTSKQEEMLEKAQGFPVSGMLDFQKVLNSLFQKNEPHERTDESDDEIDVISCASNKFDEGRLIKKSLLETDVLHIADKHQLFEYVFFQSTIITTKAELIENNQHLINDDLKLTDQEMNELMHLVDRKQSQSKDVSLRAVQKLLKWPAQSLLPALDVFRLALTLDFVAQYFFQRQSDALELIDMLCHIAAKDTSATFQFRSVVCKIFANFFIFLIGCRCLSQCALEVVDVILSFCICSPVAEVQHVAAAALYNIILFMMHKAENFDADKKLGISKRVFNCLQDMEAFGFNSLDRMCLFYWIQSLLAIIIGNSGQAFDQLVKDFDVSRRLSKIRVELSKRDDEEFMCLVDFVLLLYCNVI